MRSTLNFNSHWQFTKPGAAPVAVTLPHTWNAADGTDGGNDYFRGTCTYTKKFAAPAHADDEEVWLEFEGAAMTAVVSLNGKELTRHVGGYSTFRVNLTPALAAQNTLTVTVDNSANRTVYPQKADFTFYGGIYRDVHIFIVPHSHFALDNHGAPALRVTPEVSDDLHSAAVTVEAACENTPDGTEVLFAIEGVGEQTSPVQSGKAVTVFHIENVHLWDGVADPYLYSIAASLPGGDAVAVHFGCRKIDFKPDTGFWLNGRNVRLVGAARHQDRAGLGNALTAAEHEEDMQLLRDMGANTVRLAHYQHAQYFYNLCDKYGLVAWAEIPYITEHMPEATANTLSQMEELVLQNYNHPSIICWGLSNEITVTTGVLADATREKILRKAAEMGYKQFSYLPVFDGNSNAGDASILPVDKREIAMLTTHFLNNSHFAAMMLDRFQSELQHLHACMTIHRISPAELAAKELPSSLNTEHTAGIICFEVFDYDYAQMLCTLGIPLLFVDTPVTEMRPPLQADRLYMENRIEIQNMVAQMAQRGRKRIAFAGDKEHCQSFLERYRAYKDAAEHFGMATDWPTCATQKAQPNYSEYLYQSLRGCPTMPDAFICANDFIAMDLINALHRLGYSVPDDIWICGFDDSQEASYFSPRLTSIHIHGQIMGYAAANLLMTRIEEPSLNYRTVYTETNLILRESTGD